MAEKQKMRLMEGEKQNKTTCDSLESQAKNHTINSFDIFNPHPVQKQIIRIHHQHDFLHT